MTTLPQSGPKVNQVRTLDGRYSSADRFIAQTERRQRYQDACRDETGDILYLAPITGSRTLAQAIDQVPVMRFSEAAFAEATKRDRQRPINWTAV